MPAQGHDYSSDWQSDGTYYWRDCPCGDVTDYATHDWVVTATDDEDFFECSTCGKTKVEEHSYENGVCKNCHEVSPELQPFNYEIDQNGITITGLVNRYVTEVTIPNFVTSIGRSAFAGCPFLRSITIHDSVVSIGARAFADCSALRNVHIGSSVQKIENLTFNNCRALQTIIIPNSVISIGGYAFSDCRSLESISITDSVTTIGNRAFLNCTLLQSLTFEGTTEQWNALIANSSTDWNYSLSITQVMCSDGIVFI